MCVSQCVCVSACVRECQCVCECVCVCVCLCVCVCVCAAGLALPALSPGCDSKSWSVWFRGSSVHGSGRAAPAMSLISEPYTIHRLHEPKCVTRHDPVVWSLVRVLSAQLHHQQWSGGANTTVTWR